MIFVSSDLVLPDSTRIKVEKNITVVDCSSVVKEMQTKTIILYQQRQRAWTGTDFDQSVTDDANDNSAMEERRQADARCLDKLQAEKRTRVGLVS